MIGAAVNFQIEGKRIECPECGIPNSTSRMTCEVCHRGLWPKARKEMKMDEQAREMYAMNKKLKQAMAAGDEKSAKKIRAQIASEVKKSEGRFKVGEGGLATQAGSTAPKAKAEAKPKVMRKCPCCGEEVGGFFKMGHDGRVHGMLIKLDLGKLKETEVSKGVAAMYALWKKNKDLTMKELAQKIQ